MGRGLACYYYNVISVGLSDECSITVQMSGGETDKRWLTQGMAIYDRLSVEQVLWLTQI